MLLCDSRELFEELLQDQRTVHGVLGAYCLHGVHCVRPSPTQVQVTETFVVTQQLKAGRRRHLGTRVLSTKQEVTDCTASFALCDTNDY